MILVLDSPQERAAKHILLAKKIETLLNEEAFSSDKRQILVAKQGEHYRYALQYQPFNAPLWEAFARNYSQQGLESHAAQAQMIVRALDGGRDDQRF